MVRCLNCQNTPRMGEMYCTPCREKTQFARVQVLRKNEFARRAAEAGDLAALKIVVVDLIYELWPEQ